MERIIAKSPEAARWFPHGFSQTENGCVWVFEQEGKAIGLVAVRTIAGDAEILNLAIDPVWRGRGLGRSLLETALASCKAKGARSVFLEVRESNSVARAFYAALGFVEAGRRPGYYRDPDEAALVLSRVLF